MVWLKLSRIIFVLTYVIVVEAQRRIKGGIVSDQGKPYVVYLLKAPSSPMRYDAWLCGGAIVTEWYIITSAACVEDVLYMYAIAGYKKYVTADQLETDACTKDTKKKVVFTCVPKAYELDYAKIEKWAYIDIAVVKVESAYNFEDSAAYSSCHYTPNKIPINYETKYQEPGVDAMVLGWGHLDKWRKPEEKTDYNQPSMNYAATLIHDKQECKTFFKEFNSLDEIIDKYMICTLEGGNINDKGDLIQLSKPIADGCTPKIERLMGGDFICEEDETILLDEEDDARKAMNGRKTFSRILQRQQARTRRQGICQNDHGGPLVTWVGGHEILLGVASVFRVTNDSLCTGPYLYTSTQCNGAFIDCIIKMDETRRNDLCDQPPSEKGFDTITRTISWENHPDGPAENERIMIRPVAPINKWQQWLGR